MRFFFIIFILIFSFSAFSVVRDGLKIDYKLHMHYLELDGTIIELPTVQGTIYLNPKKAPPCKIKVGGWESDLSHACKLASDYNSDNKRIIIFSDDTFVTLMVDSLKYLNASQMEKSQLIFNKALIYQNQKELGERKISQSTLGEFIFDMSSNKHQISFKSKEHGHEIRVVLEISRFKKN